MKNQIGVGSKIGYLRRNGRYQWAEVVEMDAEKSTLKMKTDIKQGRNHRFINHFDEKIDDIIKFLNTPSEDWEDGRTLLKHKRANKLY